MIWFEFLVGVLLTWRIVYMVQNEAAPGNIFGRLRKLLEIGEYEKDFRNPAKEGSFRQLMNCHKCLSIWVAIVPALYIGWGNVLLIIGLVFAISAASIFLQDLAESRGM